ncbi:hypothetical protein MPER_12908, partial [Moniliophthora perniciosa FA553]
MNDPSIAKGTKVRLWLLQIPLPKMPPIVVGALPITEDYGAVKLLQLHKQIVTGLLTSDIHLISYACDGTETERAVQHAFSSSADSYIHIQIPSPCEGVSAHSVRIPVFSGHPIAMIQDSKHALKTFRNNLFSGARLLVVGNYAAFYQQVWEIAFSENSPLYHRDVVKLDRQDDNAAARLSSAAVLRFLANKFETENNPELLGLIVLVFTFAEAHDAYQNRNVGHAERIVMLLRARYFMNMWQKFLDGSKYSKSRYFLSREAVDIFSFLVDGLIALVIIHRDYYPTTPLLPWCHSTEGCEHTFGLSRQIVKDFSYLQFIEMMPKINVGLRTFALNHMPIFKAWTSMALGYFPSPSELERSGKRAAEEAGSLWAILGVPPEVLFADGDVEMDGNIRSGEGDEERFNEDHFDFGEEFDLEMEELQDLIHIQELNYGRLTLEQQNRLEALTNASIALQVNDHIMIHALVSEIDDDTYEEFLEEDRRHLEEYKSAAQDLNQGCFDGVTVDALVLLREKHQTYHAANAVRTRSNDKSESDLEKENRTGSSLHKEIISAFHTELKKSQDKGITSGQERNTRWTKASSTAGNSANAAAVASSNATKDASKRRKIYSRTGLDYYSRLEGADVSAFRPLKLGDYGFVWMEKQGIFLGKVITMYSKGGGKHGKHSAVTTSSNVSALSYVAVQLFEHTYGGRFKAIPSFTSGFQVHGFSLIPSWAFLSTTSASLDKSTMGM